MISRSPLGRDHVDEVSQLSGELADLARRRPKAAQRAGWIVLGLGLLGVAWLGPWMTIFYPVLWAIALVVAFAGAATVVRATRHATGYEDPRLLVSRFLDAIETQPLPFVACLSCPQVLTEPAPRCPDCASGGELFEARSPADLTLIRARFLTSAPRAE